MIEQIKSSEIKKFIEKNPKTVLLDVRTEDEWNTVGKPILILRNKNFFITIVKTQVLLKMLKKKLIRKSSFSNVCSWWKIYYCS